MLTIEKGPHNGFFIVDESKKVIMWCYCQELAEKRLQELTSI